MDTDMKYWIFIVTQKKVNGELFTSEDILEQRLTDHFWGLSERTPNRGNLKRGDKVVFYRGTPSMTISASATLASDSFKLTEQQKSQFDHGKTIFRPDFGVMLEKVQIWEHPHFIKDLIPNLNFIENKEIWGSYFQGGIRQLSEDDFRTITENLFEEKTPNILTSEEIINKSQFALEAHLEEFIDNNWQYVKFGAELQKFSVDEQNGRQFPAGQWSIDFLCIDKSDNSLVVIELKRGKTSDSTVGQLLRYMGWVSENLAKPNQEVRGIIIAHDVDDALRYAIMGLKNVRVLTYRVDFQLFPSK
jgi:predicted RNA-binding protein